jgi:hypothetical protein
LVPLTELVPGYEEGTFQGLMETELLFRPVISSRKEKQVRKQCCLSMYGKNLGPKYQPKGFKLCKKKHIVGGKEMIKLRIVGELN